MPRSPNTTPEEGAPMTAYQPGDIFYDRANGEYNMYKVIRNGDEGYLFVRAFWPDITQPTSANWKTFELRTTCEALQASECDRPTFVTSEPVTEEDEAGYREFSRIAEGISKRAEGFSERLAQADALTEEKRYEAALALYTEAASFAKNFFPIFDKRGVCFLQLERFSEAIADFEHSLSIFPAGIQSLYNCAKAYYQLGKNPKAVEKLEELLALEESLLLGDPVYKDARRLLQLVRTK